MAFKESLRPPPGDDSNSITPYYLKLVNSQREEMESLVASIESSTRRIQETASGHCASTVDSAASATLSAALARHLQSGQEACRRCKTILDIMKADGERLAKSHPQSARLQPYRAQYLSMCNMFVAAMKSHQQAKEIARTAEARVMLDRQRHAQELEAALPTAVIVSISGVSKDAGGASSKHDAAGASEPQAQKMTLQARTQADDLVVTAYDDAATRERDVTLIVRSIAEVNELFQDVAALVEHQSELIGSVQQNVERASANVEKGNDQLYKALRSRQKWRKFYCCLAVTLTILLAIGIFLAVEFFKGTLKALA